jgi:hypothetical protein
MFGKKKKSQPLSTFACQIFGEANFGGKPSS